MSGIPLKSQVSIPEWVHLIQLAECVTLRGKPERTHVQNMEYLHAHDCHQNVTHDLMNLKKKRVYRLSAACLPRNVPLFAEVSIYSKTYEYTGRYTDSHNSCMHRMHRGRKDSICKCSTKPLKELERTFYFFDGHNKDRDHSQTCLFNQFSDYSDCHSTSYMATKTARMHSSVDAICNLLQPDWCAACVYTSGVNSC